MTRVGEFVGASGSSDRSVCRSFRSFRSFSLHTYHNGQGSHVDGPKMPTPSNRPLFRPSSRDLRSTDYSLCEDAVRSAAGPPRAIWPGRRYTQTAGCATRRYSRFPDVVISRLVCRDYMNHDNSRNHRWNHIAQSKALAYKSTFNLTRWEHASPLRTPTGRRRCLAHRGRPHARRSPARPASWRERDAGHMREARR